MQIVELWRYPFKSMMGERLDEARVGPNGIPGDRAWCVRNANAIQGAKKYPGLMNCAAAFRRTGASADGLLTATATDSAAPVITLSSGEQFAADDPDAGHKLSTELGHVVTVHPLQPAENEAFYRRERRSLDDARVAMGLEDGERMPDLSGFPETLVRHASPPGTFFDAFPLLVMTTASLAALGESATGSVIDSRRFRPNILIDTGPETGFVENDWEKRQLVIGDARLELTLSCPRCSMVTHGFDDLPRDTSIMRTLVQVNAHRLGIYARILNPGVVAVGDTAMLDPQLDP